MRRTRNTIDLEGLAHMAPLGPRTTRKAKQIILGASVATIFGNIARLRGTKVRSDGQSKETGRKKHTRLGSPAGATGRGTAPPAEELMRGGSRTGKAAGGGKEDPTRERLGGGGTSDEEATGGWGLAG